MATNTQEDIDNLGFPRIEVNVGMSCGGCSGAINKVLEKRKDELGIKEVAFRLATAEEKENKDEVRTHVGITLKKAPTAGDVQDWTAAATKIVECIRKTGKPVQSGGQGKDWEWAVEGEDGIIVSSATATTTTS